MGWTRFFRAGACRYCSFKFSFAYVYVERATSVNSARQISGLVLLMFLLMLMLNISRQFSNHQIKILLLTNNRLSKNIYFVRELLKLGICYLTRASSKLLTANLSLTQYFKLTGVVDAIAIA